MVGGIERAGVVGALFIQIRLRIVLRSTHGPGLMPGSLRPLAGRPDGTGAMRLSPILDPDDDSCLTRILEGKSTEGEPLRKVLLLAVLAMAATMVFAPVTLAQEDPCPDPEFPRETPDGCQASDLPDVEFGSDASATASPTASPPPGREGDPCGSFVIGTPEADECYRSFGLEPLEPGDASPSASPIASTTGGPLTPLPSDSGSPSPSASATATPTASVLPETGGPASAAFGIVSLGLLVVTGIMALGIMRRS